MSADRRDARAGGRGGRPRGGQQRGSAPHRTPGRDGAPTRRRLPDTARGVALGVIMAVREDDAYANLLLPTRIRRAGLRSDDAALATELTYGTLRGWGLYEQILARAAGRGLNEIDRVSADVLRLGAHQLLSTRIPAHAAVHETVEVARAVVPERALGFINAVMRRISERSHEEWVALLLAEGVERGADARLALETAHPTWIVAALRESLAADPSVLDADADLRELLHADNQAPTVSLASMVGERGAEAPGGVTDLPYSPRGLRWPGGDPGQWSAIADGSVRVQDEGSQLAALALSRAHAIASNEIWLDMCAGPGGKSALLAAELLGTGGNLIANESVPARADLVRDSVRAVQEVVTVLEGDARRFVEQPGHYDRILLDAPCTGLGALRRRPEARWRKDPDDLAALVRLQSQLLDAAAVALKPGGVLAYVTCSPHLAETREQVDALLARRSGLRSLDTGAVLQSFARTPLPGVQAGMPVVQLWPHRHGTDAMFITLFEKVPR